jgi:hypothetical protein
MTTTSTSSSLSVSVAARGAEQDDPAHLFPNWRMPSLSLSATPGS